MNLNIKEGSRDFRVIFFNANFLFDNISIEFDSMWPYFWYVSAYLDMGLLHNRSQDGMGFIVLPMYQLHMMNIREVSMKSTYCSCDICGVYGD